MKAIRHFAVVAAALTLAVAAGAHEKSVKLKDLPEAVRKTVLEQSKGGKIRGLSSEVEDGKTIYEAELKFSAGRKDVSIDETGAVIEIEETVALASLPPAVMASLEKAAGKGRITSVEAISKNGAVTMYEAQVHSGRLGRIRSEVKILPDGSPVIQAPPAK